MWCCVQPAGGLKFLAEYALKRKPKYHYKDVRSIGLPGPKNLATHHGPGDQHS